MRHLCRAGAGILASAIIALPPLSAQSQTEVQRRGARLAAWRCASCHAVASEVQSPLPFAPPFRDIAQRYADGGLDRRLTGLREGHPLMPPGDLQPDEALDLSSYIATLAPKPRPPQPKVSTKPPQD